MSLRKNTSIPDTVATTAVSVGNVIVPVRRNVILPGSQLTSRLEEEKKSLNGPNLAHRCALFVLARM